MRQSFVIHDSAQGFIHRAWAGGDSIPFTSVPESALQYVTYTEARFCRDRLQNNGKLINSNVLAICHD